MSKNTAEKVKESHSEKDTHSAKEPHAHGAPKEAHAKEGKEGHTSHPQEPKKSKGHVTAPGGCFSQGCKVQAKRFNFCDEHFDHFKFGLLKKTGEPVSDYEKKIEHFYAHQMRLKMKKSVPKAA